MVKSGAVSPTFTMKPRSVYDLPESQEVKLISSIGTRKNMNIIFRIGETGTDVQNKMLQKIQKNN